MIWLIETFWKQKNIFMLFNFAKSYAPIQCPPVFSEQLEGCWRIALKKIFSWETWGTCKNIFEKKWNSPELLKQSYYCFNNSGEFQFFIFSHATSNYAKKWKLVGFKEHVHSSLDSLEEIE